MDLLPQSSGEAQSALGGAFALPFFGLPLFLVSASRQAPSWLGRSARVPGPHRIEGCGTRRLSAAPEVSAIRCLPLLRPPQLKARKALVRASSLGGILCVCKGDVCSAPRRVAAVVPRTSWHGSPWM